MCVGLSHKFEVIHYSSKCPFFAHSNCQHLFIFQGLTQMTFPPWKLPWKSQAEKLLLHLSMPWSVCLCNGFVLHLAVCIHLSPTKLWHLESVGALVYVHTLFDIVLRRVGAQFCKCCILNVLRGPTDDKTWYLYTFTQSANHGAMWEIKPMLFLTLWGLHYSSVVGWKVLTTGGCRRT